MGPHSRQPHTTAQISGEVGHGEVKFVEEGLAVGDCVAKVGQVLGDVPDPLEEVHCKRHQDVPASLCWRRRVLWG